MTTHSPTPEGHGIASFVARHERALAAAWLALCTALVATMAVWGIVLNGAERAVDRASVSWLKRLAEAEQLLAQGHSSRALAALERIDRECPATFVKHRHDRERERLLAALAHAYRAEGRKKRALETLERAVEFDPKNFGNHFRLAELARELGEDDRARTGYEAVLAIHPTHLPSAAARMDMDFAAGRYEPAVETFERYIDAWQLATVHLQVGTTRVALDVPVDGRVHELEVLCEVEAGWSGPLELQTHGYSARVESFEAIPALLAGEAPRPTLRLEADAAWTAAGGTSPASGELLASDTSAMLQSPPVTATHGVARVRMKLGLFRSISPTMWKQAEKSFANRLLAPRWRELLPRLRRGGAPEAGSVFED
jgi:tetratricopeptide (TPR) repeat protein